jgi:hypothetical protein
MATSHCFFGPPPSVCVQKIPGNCRLAATPELSEMRELAMRPTSRTPGATSFPPGCWAGELKTETHNTATPIMAILVNIKFILALVRAA